MLRPCAGILLSLMLTTPVLAVAAPDSTNKDASTTPAGDKEKVQAQLKDATQLEVLAWRLASQFYLYGAQGKTAPEMAQLQKIRSTGSRLADRTDNKVQAAWEQLAATISEGDLDAEGKPSVSTHKRLTEKLDALSAAVDDYVGELRKTAKLSPKGHSEALKEAAVKLESVVINGLSGQESPEQKKLLSQLNSRFEGLESTYGGESGKAVMEATKKWPVLREALLKGKDKNPIFIISRFHDQIAEDLDNALNNLPRY